MADEGHEATEALIGEVSERVRREYVAAYEGAEAKLADYLRRFEAKDRIHAEAVRRGKETEADYREWRRGQILVGKRWQEMVDTLAEDYRNADRIAASIVNGHVPDAYAINHDYATFQVERGSNLDTSYTLYDRATVERLTRDQPDLLPAVKVDGKKDLAWNRKHIASAITQGVLQGESMDRVARRLRSVADMDYRAAMRTARTTMTSAQNAGRVDAYRRAEGMGVHVRKQWLATLDRRTRHSHRRLDGEVVGMDESFSNGLGYPGDPGPGIGSEVYNCRCTLVPVVDGADPAEGVRHSNLGGVSYEEWKTEHLQRTIPTATAVVDGSNVIGQWTRRKSEYEFEIEDVLNYQGFDGDPRVVDADEFERAVGAANGGRGFIAQRSYTGPTKEVADEYRRALYNGKWYVDCSTGGAQYGQGMYCAADWTGKLTDGIRSEMAHYTRLGSTRSGVKADLSEDEKLLKIRRAAEELVGDGPGSDVDAVYTCLRYDLGVSKPSVADNREAYRTARKYDYRNEAFQKGLQTSLEYSSVSYVETMTLDPSARVITYSELDRIRSYSSLSRLAAESMNVSREDREALIEWVDSEEDWEDAPTNVRDWAHRISDGVDTLMESDYGTLAAAMGYDAINAEGHGASGSYTVVLNRTKLIIKRPEGWK